MPIIGFRYNSYHKIITGLLLVLWAIIHFSGNTEPNYYKNGQIISSGGKANNKNQGVWTWFYPNGSNKIRGNFIEGKRSGVWIYWDINGIKIKECNYNNDLLNGWTKEWNSKGNLRSKTYFVNDEVTNLEP